MSDAAQEQLQGNIQLSIQGDILVVDDQPVNVRLLATILTQLGYKVRKATSGEMALTAIHAEPPDLILLDITMPQMDGYELCQILKANPNTANIPVMFVSALDESMDKAKAFEVGAIDYVAKPFQWAEVQARVNTQMLLLQLQRQVAAPEPSPAMQAALSPAQPPAIASLEITVQAFGRSIFHLWDWQPTALRLTLAHTHTQTATTPIVLATLRGILQGLGAELDLERRVNQARALIEPDLTRFGTTPRLFHGELSGANHNTVTYTAIGYGVTLIRQSAMPQASSGSVTLKPDDCLLIFSGDLQLKHPDLMETLVHLVATMTAPLCGETLLQALDSKLTLSESIGAPLMLLHYRGC